MDESRIIYDLCTIRDEVQLGNNQRKSLQDAINVFIDILNGDAILLHYGKSDNNSYEVD